MHNDITKFSEKLKNSLFNSSLPHEGIFELFTKKYDNNNFLHIKNENNGLNTILQNQPFHSIFINTDDVNMPKKINQIGNTTLDNTNNESISNEQLLIDINSQDSNDFSNSMGNNLEIGKTLNENNINNYKKRIKLYKHYNAN